MQHGSVISPLLFSVVSSEWGSGLPAELLYASDLVLIARTMEQPGIRVAEWRVSILDKGLKVNSGKSKVMVGSSGGKMIVNSGKRLIACGPVVCLSRPMEGKGSHSNFQFLGELPVPPHPTGVVETLNKLSFLYHSGIMSTIIIVRP